MPDEVYKMCVNGALIVGSRAIVAMGEDGNPDDWDLIVPPEKWHSIALIIPNTATPNSFGGWNFEVSDYTKVYVDVWPDTVQRYLTNFKSDVYYQGYVLDFLTNRYYSSGVIT